MDWVGYDGMDWTGYDGVGYDGMGQVSPALLSRGSAGSDPASCRPHVPALPWVWNPFASPAVVFSQQGQSSPRGLGAAAAPAHLLPLCFLTLKHHLAHKHSPVRGARGHFPASGARTWPQGTQHPNPALRVPFHWPPSPWWCLVGWVLRPCPLRATHGPIQPRPSTHAQPTVLPAPCPGL